MLAWMLYAIVASVMVGAAALALERVMHAVRRPTRFVWAGAMLLSLAWPVLMLVVPRTQLADAPASAIRSSVSDGMHTVSNTVALASERALNVSVETIVLAMWALLTALLAARVIHAFHTNAVRAKGWRFATVEGIKVRTSTDVGPAVVGVASMEVVLPEWVLALDRTLLDLVLAHEQEHRDARDPLLLFGAAVVVCLMPWNVALIWQARRLRAAMEVDCDARVLRRYPDTERYGLLLLAIAQRRSAASPMLGATMSEPAANLSRRFAAMKNNPVSRVRLSALCAFGIAAIIAACAIEAPTAPGPVTSAGATAPRANARTDTSRTMRYIIKGFDGLPDLELVVPTQSLPEPKMIETTERLLVTYTRTLERTGSNDAAVEAVLPDIGRIKALVGELFKVCVGDTQLPNSEVKLSETPKQSCGSDRMTAKERTARQQNRVLEEERAAFGRTSESQKLTASAETDSAGKSMVAAKEFAKVQETHAELEKVHLDTAKLIQSSLILVYPEVLKSAATQGEVVVSFVVDANGLVDLATFRVLKSSHTAFTEAVRKAVANARYTPATANGRPVRQLVQLPVTFSIK